MYGLKNGTLVRAKRNLDPGGAGVKRGTLGVVFEETVYADGDGKGMIKNGEVFYGPNVRWMTGGSCNVYPGQVRIITGSYRSMAGICAAAQELLRPQDDYHGWRKPRRHSVSDVRVWAELRWADAINQK